MHVSVGAPDIGSIKLRGIHRNVYFRFYKYASAYAVRCKLIASGILLGLAGGIQFHKDARNQQKTISGRPPGWNKNGDVTRSTRHVFYALYMDK